MIAITQLDVEHYEVAVGSAGDESVHRVRLTPTCWRELTARRVTPEGLLMETIRFLLARTDAEAIPDAFDLATLGDRYPDWPAHAAAWVERDR
jgi:hypothetical protein